MRILISGAGIAGLTLGYWLQRHGFEPTIVEVAPGVRGGGYMIDFWGLGYDVAERMVLLDALGRAHQVGIYPVAGRKLATFFVFSAPRPLGHLTAEARKQMLREVFGPLGWETPRILERMDSSPDFYFDAVSQIRLPAWSEGRIALVGDACQCVSLIAGQGSALAMAGAYILAGELKKADGDPVRAFERYEAILKPEIARKQQMARRFASSFVPSSRLGIFARNTFVKLMFVPVLARYFIRQFLSDELRLEQY